MRVLFLTTKRQPPLGADTWIHLEILRAVDRAAVEAHVACATGPRDQPSPTYEQVRQIPDVVLVPVDLGREVSDGSIRQRVLALLSLVPAAWSVLRLARYIRRHGIEVIYTTERPRDAAVGVLLSKVTPARSLVHLHVGFHPGWMRRSQQWAIRQADAVVAISEFVASTVRDIGRDPESVHVVLNGIRLERWEPGADRARTRAELGLDESTGVVLTVCRLFRAKGVSELVEAMRDLGDEVPAQLLVVGAEMERGYLQELREQVRVAGLGDRVSFLGSRDDVPALMAAADVFAMPSEWEPFGLVFAEAMAMRLPVVALDNGGTVEVVDDGLTGLLSAPHDRVALAAHLRELLADPARRRAMGEVGRRRVEEHFTTQRMASDTVRVYRTVARGARELPGSGSARERRTEPGPQASPGRGTGMRNTLDVDAEGFAAALDHDGFVVLRDVVSKEHLEAFREDLLGEFGRLADSGQLFEGGGSYSGHLNCFPGIRARFIYEELVQRGVVDLVRSYRPDLVEFPRPTLNFNLPGSVAQHYHMDDAFLREFLICNIGVVDTDLVNGAIDVLPGTNRRYYEFWRYALERKYRLSTRIPMGVGDVVVRKSTLWHRGMPNRSSTPRPMMAITFGEIRDPSFDPWATNGGEIEFYPNWFSTSRIGRIREKTFVRAPITYSSYRFVTSLYGKRGYASWSRLAKHT